MTQETFCAGTGTLKNHRSETHSSTYSRREAVALLAASLLGACSGSGSSDTATTPAAASSPSSLASSDQSHFPNAQDTAKSLGRGINLGNVFEAPREGDWGLLMDDGFPTIIAKVGFQSVRVPVRWSNHAALTADAKIDEDFARRVDRAIDGFLAQGLTVVVNMHHYRQFDGDPLDAGETAVADADVVPRFLNIWRQLSQRYAGRSSKLLFEIYNEPHGTTQATRWNSLVKQALDIIRLTNPRRVVVAGPVDWHNARALASFQAPADTQFIATIHHYEPFEFTHQGASWIPNSSAWLGTTCCNTTQKQQLVSQLELAKTWAAKHNIPMWLGEFGAYEKADMNSRAQFTRLMRDEAEARGMPWAYWEFASLFGAYDPVAKAWREPLRNALLG